MFTLKRNKRMINHQFTLLDKCINQMNVQYVNIQISHSYLKLLLGSQIVKSRSKFGVTLCVGERHFLSKSHLIYSSKLLKL